MFSTYFKIKFDLSNTYDVVDETSFVESGYNANWCFQIRNDNAL